MSKAGQKICLIDGSGYIYRAFYAIPSMTRPKDQTPINAVYGFTSMLMQFFRENQYECIGVVFDAERHNFRNDIYPQYKATRRETPEELIPQFPIIRQAVKAFNVISVEEEGFEADDLIASYTKAALDLDMDVVIVSADKDLMQLMGPHVSIYDPMKKQMLGNEDVEAKFGVSAAQVVDVQALAGDTSDNVPGIKGIGVKTAAELIQEFGSLENLLENADQIPQARRRDLIKNGKEMALISKKLVTLNENAPLPRPIDDFCAQKPVAQDVRAFLEENGFKSLLGRLNGFMEGSSNEPASLPSAAVEIRYEAVQDRAALQKWADMIKKAGIVAVDTETDSLNPFETQMAGISLCVEEGHACYIPLRHESPNSIGSDKVDLFNFDARPVVETIQQVTLDDVREILLPVLQDPAVVKIGHNIKFDLQVFKTEFGDDFKMEPVEDTIVMAYDLDGTSHGLSMDELAQIYLHMTTIRYEDVCGKGRHAILFKHVPLEKAVPYSAEDADITMRLYHMFLPRLAAEKVETVYRDIDRPLITVLTEMERRGILVDKNTLMQLSLKFADKMDQLEKEIYDLAGEYFNINSPIQFGEILFEKMKLEGGKKNSKTGYWSTDQEALEALAAQGIELPAKMLDYRQYSKLKTTYADALTKMIDPKSGHVHTTFSQTVTATGRLASNNPNLQNIPIRTEAGRLIRSAFVAEPGCVLLSADYSQIELRLIADVANVKGLKDAFAKGLDIHAATASQVFGVPIENMDPMIRRNAKAINFGIIYGISPFGLARQLGITKTDAKKYIDSYMAQYPEIGRYMDDTIQFAKEHGYILTPFGRKCFISGFDNGATRGFASRAAINAPIQGGAADMIKMAMNKMPGTLKEAGLKTAMILQVHDELIFETPEAEIEQASALIKKVMENIVTLTVPLEVEIGTGQNWTQAH